ncbi:EamA family transporter, partial [Weissella paramesenteroides]
MASQLLIFSFIGMLPSQLAYFMAIKYGNAATGTILQFLGPIFILLFLIIRWHLKPSRTDILSVLLAFLGTFLLVTQGNITQLALSISAIVWGILSG